MAAKKKVKEQLIDPDHIITTETVEIPETVETPIELDETIFETKGIEIENNAVDLQDYIGGQDITPEQLLEEYKKIEPRYYTTPEKTVPQEKYDLLLAAFNKLCERVGLDLQHEKKLRAEAGL